MSKVFETMVRIRFAHCDPAGIVFHPQYFTIFNGVVEDFFHQVVGVPFMELRKRGMGMPVVGIRCDFTGASRPGDDCLAQLRIEKLGRSSIRMAMLLSCRGEERVRMAETIVIVALGEHMKSIPIPEDLRARMQPYVVEPGATPLALRA